MKQILAVRTEPFGDELKVVEASGANFVNVDTISRPGILRAERMGLVPSGMADLIVTNDLDYSVEHLYDVDHRGRVLALFRHPVDRLISRFYYASVATWERSYQSTWKDMDLQYWAEKINWENNIFVKSLSGRERYSYVTEDDLSVAIMTVRKRLIVGLTSQMEESIHRFNIFMGIDETEDINRQCMDEYFGHGVKKSNANSHPKVNRVF